jgi:hypothetical protein
MTGKSTAGDFGFIESETFYPLVRAKSMAASAQKDDLDWLYSVIPPEGNEKGLAKVVVFDENGIQVGTL